MRYRVNHRSYQVIATIAAIIAAGPGSAGTTAADEPPPDLLAIMQKLNADTLRLTNALLVEDWDVAASSADAIAEHPMAPLKERMKILSHLGTLAGQFRAHDETVHHAAVSAADAAARGDAKEAGKQYGILIEGCLSCHQSFRKEIRALRLERDEAAAAVDD